MHLTDEEINLVLDTEQPPYSLAKLPAILGRPIEPATAKADSSSRGRVARRD